MISRTKSRPLLAAAAGVASVTMSCAGGSCLSGNLMALPQCPANRVQDAVSNECYETCPPGQHLPYPMALQCEFDRDAGDAGVPTDAATDGGSDAATDAGDGG